MVNLTRIYTRIGDAGTTNLSDMSTTSKTDARVRAYGDVDEANSWLGVALATGDLPEEVASKLRVIQNELFDVGADLSTPLVVDPRWEPLRIAQPSIDRLESWCDELLDGLPALRSFILPGGKQSASYLHVARTVVRRAERSAWTAVEERGSEPGTRDGERPAGVNLLAVRYLNRLSDLLFVMTRVVNGTTHEVLWVPGGERAAD